MYTLNSILVNKRGLGHSGRRLNPQEKTQRGGKEHFVIFWHDEITAQGIELANITYKYYYYSYVLFHPQEVQHNYYPE